MEAAFDSIAHQYDTTFTFTRVGEKQRDRVWAMLLQSKLLEKKLNILEVNCGTGQDAIRFAQNGHSVLATDISPEMIKVCRSKTEKATLPAPISFQQLGFQQIDSLEYAQKFDLIFSNFGGLNCISPFEIQRFIDDAHTLLKPGGSMIAVIMPSFCLWETLYYAGKTSFQKAFRRLAKKTEAVIENNTFPVYYYQPDTISRMSRKKFQLNKLAPVGLFLPPSYLEHFFNKRKRLLHVLNNLEKFFSPVSVLAYLSDHYYIQLIKK